MTTEFGPCTTWPTKWPCDISCESPSATGTAAAFATEVVWALSGRQFGTCDVTFRPCRRSCMEAPWLGAWTEWPGSTGWPHPALVGGQWFNLICGGCAGDCSCSSISEVLMPSPVDHIVEIKVDGSILVTGSYRLDNNRLLVRTDGQDWPSCNDLSLNDTEPDTWSVTAAFGRSVPESGSWAVGELACELMKAMRGEDCRLPHNVTQLVRQGVMLNYADPVELFTMGRTGLYLADMFIAAFNRNHLTGRARVYDVDGPRVRRSGT